ncbi:AAA family ATPase [Erysipelotrichaceae bacterium HCN-30851]
MDRTILDNLKKWRDKKNKKPLIIKGARQVGKTYIIREFAKECYSDIVEINFERDLDFINVFKTSHNPKDLLEYFQITFMDKNFDSNTLIFMDEIQACSDALTSLKFLAEDFPCDIICSGSALGVAIANTTSYPVRYVETWEMYPMSFIEFLRAYGINEAIIDKIREAVINLTPISEILHEKMNDLFKTYMLIGGMPEVVKTYLETKSLYEALNIQRAIVDDYIKDMVKYANNTDAMKIRECFSSIPLQLAKENQKFQYSVVKKGYNARYYNNSLRWLEDSDLIIKVHRISNIQYPLKGQVELSVFKVFMADVGLFISQLEDGDIRKIVAGEMGIYKGAIYENIVAQILKSHHKSSYYFEPSQTSEIDFIIEYRGEISPIEVKAGRNTASISFKNFIHKYEPKYAFRFSQKNIGKDDANNVCYFPLYAIDFVLENEGRII